MVKGEWEVIAQVSVLRDENVLETDRDDVCTIGVQLMPLTRVL